MCEIIQFNFMTISDFNQENVLEYARLLADSKDLLLLEFDRAGKVLSVNRAFSDLLGWGDGTSQELKISCVFDFRIAEVEKILAEKTEYACGINLVSVDREFIPSKTIFKVQKDKIIALSVPMSSVCEDKNLHSGFLKPCKR